MARKTGRVTATEVARRSGVSQATVSYVLNNDPRQKISDSTRERVLRTVAELGYTPSEPARALRSGRSSIVLFVTPDYPVGYVIGAVIDHLLELLVREGRTLLTHRFSAEVPLLDVVRGLLPFAVISMAPLDVALRGQLRALGAEVEVIGFREQADADVRHPQEHVGRLQAEHLVERGHRRIAYALSDDERAEMFARPRLEAVQAYCAEHSLPEPVIGAVPPDLDRAAEIVRSWRAEGVTAVCAFTDDVAIAVIGGASSAGLAVPGDLSVIGVDDIPLAAVTVPPLTTVHLDVEVMARALVRPLGVATDSDDPDAAQAWVVERSSTSPR